MLIVQGQFVPALSACSLSLVVAASNGVPAWLGVKRVLWLHTRCSLSAVHEVQWHSIALCAGDAGEARGRHDGCFCLGYSVQPFAPQHTHTPGKDPVCTTISLKGMCLQA